MRRLLVLQVPSPPSGNPSPSIGRGKARAVTPDEFEPSGDDARTAAGRQSAEIAEVRNAVDGGGFGDRVHFAAASSALRASIAALI